MPRGLGRTGLLCVWDLGLGSPPPHTLASWRNWPSANLELSRDKLWAFLVCLFPGGFQRLSRIMSHPCSALPLASPFTRDRVSSTFPSTARKALSAVCTPPSPVCFLLWYSRLDEAGTLLPRGLCTCCLLSASPSRCSREFLHSLPICMLSCLLCQASR